MPLGMNTENEYINYSKTFRSETKDSNICESTPNINIYTYSAFSLSKMHLHTLYYLPVGRWLHLGHFGEKKRKWWYCGSPHSPVLLHLPCSEMPVAHL